MKREKLNELFAEWKKKNCFEEDGKLGQFVPDGIVDYDVFEMTDKKILFVLRDAHDLDNDYEDRGICDEVLHSLNSGKTWYPIAVWARGILESNKTFLSTDELKREPVNSEDEIDGIRKYYKRIAIMNLKKVSGGSVAKDIAYYSREHATEIRKEIEIINPDIIIACGSDVYELLVENIFKIDLLEAMQEKIDLSDKMKNYGHYINVGMAFSKETPMYLVHYRHPAQYGRSGKLEVHYSNMKKIRNTIDLLFNLEVIKEMS